METTAATIWPPKESLFGVNVSVTHYQEVVQTVVDSALRGEAGIATFLPVHGIVTAATDAQYREKINQFNIVAPDGQPVRWSLNFFHKANLTDRVYGPETMRRCCERAAETGVSIFLYGSTPDVLKQLSASLVEMFPALKIAGVESPPFRPLSGEENDEACNRINESGAGLVFIGLGCPRQEAFAFKNRNKIRGVQLCVGAAFDFHAGNKKTAPAIMQKYGMEWLFRLSQEPGRLWKRYLVTNSIFCWLFFVNFLKGGRRPATHGRVS
jgi:N-acetylglucosaminyldiphosphoundecaprenol N-acetyl-beta-D-mannosaminyltransferase